MRRRYVPTMHQNDLVRAIDKARDYHRSHGAIDPYSEDTPDGLAYCFAEALVQVADRCVIGAPCARHVGVVHGREAEELRRGVEKILTEYAEHDAYGTCKELRQRFRQLLDEVDARDSLAFLEAGEAAP